jgi:mono/diheme cytochrome c family protein
MLVALLILLALLGGEPTPVTSPANRWAEPTRGILAQRCGQCHLPNLPTSVPRALAVFNLTDDPWYGRLTHEQYGDLLHRLRAAKDLPESDAAIVERFVRCARDQVCPSADPVIEGAGP